MVNNKTARAASITFDSYIIGVMIVLMFAAVIDGAAPKWLRRVFPPPIIMFILVMIVSLIALVVDARGLAFSLTSDSINSDALQTLYLPPLLFSDVMRLNIRTFRRSFWQVMWLIFPGVIGGAALTALYPLFIMPSGPPFFSTYEALAFGGAMSTTDPIAVLMVLDDIGAPKRLAAMVGGESLLNDGTSIVIVTLFLELQQGMEMSGEDIAAFCFQEIFAGTCFGFVVGVATLGMMRRVENNTAALVTLSFAMPYLTFAVCLYKFETSGVLAVIALGLVLNRFGHAFLQKDLESVEGFWDQVEFIATMLLYAQVGLFVASDFLQGSIDGTDWGSLVGLFLWILLVRLIVVVVSFPVLTRIGYGLSWREGVVLWHAGLRGAVGILLSFSIKNAPGVSSRTGALVLFFTAGVVVLFLFNVVTTGPLCRLLGLQFDSSNKVYCRMKLKVQENTIKTLMCTGMAEEIARQGISVYIKDDGHSEADDKNTHGIQPPHLHEEHEHKRQALDEDMLANTRQHVCMAFKATFQGLMETELIPRTAWFLLVNACEKKIDTMPVSELLTFDDVLGKGTFFRWFAKLTIASSSLGCCGRRMPSSLCFCRQKDPNDVPENISAEAAHALSNNKRGVARARKLALQEMLLNRFSDTDEKVHGDGVPHDESGEQQDLFSAVETLAYCAFGLIVAHQRGRRVIHEIFAVFDTSDSENNSSINASGHGLNAHIKHATEMRQIFEESRRDCIRPARFLDLVFRKFPRVIEKIKSAHARAQVHDRNIHVVGAMKRAGFVSGVALKQLILEVERIDHSVEKLSYPVVPPFSVGKAGAGLGGNPNFGPFASDSAKTHHPPVRMPSVQVVKASGSHDQSMAAATAESKLDVPDEDDVTVGMPVSAGTSQALTKTISFQAIASDPVLSGPTLDFENAPLLQTSETAPAVTFHESEPQGTVIDDRAAELSETVVADEEHRGTDVDGPTVAIRR